MKKEDVLKRRDILTEQNYIIKDQKEECNEFLDNYTNNNLWIRFSFGVIGLGITLGAIGFWPGMLAGCGAMLGSGALLIAPVVQAKKLLKNTAFEKGVNIFNMTTKVSRYKASLEKVEEANKEEIALIDKCLLKNDISDYRKSKDEFNKYNTAFITHHEKLYERLENSSKQQQGKDEGK